MGILGRILDPKDLQGLSDNELVNLAAEIRDFLVANVSRTGGHLGPNLGVVELSIALHRVFSSPKDALIFDVGHQCYSHKLLTGRQDFSDLRSFGGISGYPSRSESEHDVVENSHASAALSWADGISRAWSLTGRQGHVVAVVGDGALTGGMCWEALNNISYDNVRRLVIVVNDNGRSYAPTIGGVARFLNAIRGKKSYLWLRRSSEKFFNHLGPLGRGLYRGVRGGIHGFLSRFTNTDRLFSNLDIRYLGPVNGHDLRAVESALEQAKAYGRPVILHVITEKGKGYSPAQKDPHDHLHAVGPINPSTGKPISATKLSWTEVFGRRLVELAEENPRLVGVTAAMLRPTALHLLAQKFPDRVVDVGIAEQHAITSAAGLAYGGLHPVVAIYSTFINRTFDQILMDVGLHSAGVTLVLDRAGITGPDGPSHHGMWDISLLQVVPNIAIAAPRDAFTLCSVLDTAVSVEDRPTVLRFPRGSVGKDLPVLRELPDSAEVIYEDRDADIMLLSVGAMASVAVSVARRLSREGAKVLVVDPVWAIPIPKSVIDLSSRVRLVVSIEDGVRVGGVGATLRQELRAAGFSVTVLEIGLPADFMPQGSRGEILHLAGLSEDGVYEQINRAAGDRRPPLLRGFERG